MKRNETTNCNECLHYDVCEWATNKGDICSDFKQASRFVEMPCVIGDTVYKICPKCNPNHNGSCEHCAWSGCSIMGCDVGVRVHSDGSHEKYDLQIVPYKVTEYRFITVIKNWNIMFFATPEEAELAKREYDKIRQTEERKSRYEKYLAWEKNRKINYPFLQKDRELE